MAEKDKGSMDMEAVDKAEASKKKREEPNSAHNVYDTAFRTIIEFGEQFITAVINEILGTDYPLDVHVEKLKGRHPKQDSTIETDIFVRIEDISENTGRTCEERDPHIAASC